MSAVAIDFIKKRKKISFVPFFERGEDLHQKLRLEDMTVLPHASLPFLGAETESVDRLSFSYPATILCFDMPTIDFL